MKFIKDLTSLYSIINSHQEVVLYPAGNEGRTLMELFRYTGVIYHICCLTAAKLANDNARQFVHSIPMIQLDHLPHLRNTAVFIVVAPTKFCEDIHNHLIKFGCDNVISVGDNVHKEVIATLQQLSNSGQLTNWYFSYFYNKITEMRYRIDEQNEVCAVNSKTFGPYRNKFRGKKVVIFATGPTSNYYRPIKDAIHIGLNFAWKKENVPLNYLFTNDGPLPEMRADMEQGFDKISDGLFISKFMDRIGHCYNNYPEDVSLRWKNVHRFYIDDSVDNPIYQDICYHPLMCCASVVFAALHFSLFTYPKEIYLVGCDAGSNYEHFYENKDDGGSKFFPHLEKIKVVYARMKMFAAQHYPETEIISVNPVGLKGLFRDIYTDNLRDSGRLGGGVWNRDLIPSTADILKINIHSAIPSSILREVA